jgi:hypothetical protein
LSVIFFAHEKAALHVLRFPAGFYYVSAGILRHVLDSVIEGLEFAVGDDVHAGLFQFFLAKGAVIFKLVAVRRTADDQFPLRAQRLRLFALPQGVVENDDVGIVAVRLNHSIRFARGPLPGEATLREEFKFA